MASSFLAGMDEEIRKHRSREVIWRQGRLFFRSLFWASKRRDGYWTVKGGRSSVLSDIFIATPCHSIPGTIIVIKEEYVMLCMGKYDKQHGQPPRGMVK